MPNQLLMSLHVALPLALAIVAVCAPPDASAQSSSDQTVQSAAKTGVYRDLSANILGMMATRQDKAEIEAALAKTNALLGRASPAVRAWVQDEGLRQAHGNPSESAVAAAARERFGNDLSSMDIDALIQLVMMEAAQQEDQALRDQIAQMRAANQQKRAQRELTQKMHEHQSAMRSTAQAEFRPAQPRVARADLVAYVARVSDGKDSLDDLSEEQQLKMQMMMDRMSKALEAMGNLEKKMSETANSIIGNLK